MTETISEFEFEVPIVSEANRREHWAKHTRRKNDQKLATLVAWRQHVGAGSQMPRPLKIVLTLRSSRKLDSDNLAGAFKGIRDQIAAELGTDDGDESVQYCYGWEKLSKRTTVARVEVVR